MTEKTIKVDYLARVEGESGMWVRIKNGRVADVKLKIFEPPRFFEAFLRGRSYFIEAYEPPEAPFVACEPRQATGYAATEGRAALFTTGTLSTRTESFRAPKSSRRPRRIRR